MMSMLNEKNKFYEAAFMGMLTCFCFSLFVFRYFYTGSIGYIFLNWNLFLAFVPWALTTFALQNQTVKKSKLSAFMLISTWILFFPNAPYILTDLFHLRNESMMPVWFDLIMILSFAWTGLLFGLLSLWDIEKFISGSTKPVYIAIGSSLLLFLGSFGVYIGRYLRWNSWDILQEPSNLMYDIGDRIINPLDHPRTWGLTIFMGILLNMIYWSFRLIRKRNQVMAHGSN